MECSRRGRGCRGSVQEWRLWKPRDKEAVVVYLCASHSKELESLYGVGERDLLPARPRISLAPTKLKPVRETRHLKLRK